MKRLADDKEVLDRQYYYLLDWNEQDNWNYMSRTFGKIRLCDLTLIEFKRLFLHAVNEDYKRL